MTKQSTLNQKILAAVQHATIGPGALHEPVLGDAERRHADACIESGWVSYAGSYVTQFESQLAAITGAKHVIAMTSGTAALHVCLMMDLAMKFWCRLLRSLPAPTPSPMPARARTLSTSIPKPWASMQTA